MIVSTKGRYALRVMVRFAQQGAHMAAGLGLKAAMNENFVLSVDWAMAFDKQDNAKWANFYIKMGYLF